VGAVSCRHSRASLEAVAVAGERKLEQPAGLLDLGEPVLDVAKLPLGKWSPPASVTPTGQQPAHLIDRESRIAEESDYRQALKDRGLVVAATVHASRGTQQARFFVIAESGWAEPRAPCDLPDGKRSVCHGLDFKCT
jgi:hypothetical protein